MFVNDVLACSLNSTPAEILPRCLILFPQLHLESRSGSCPFHSVNSQILNHILNSYQSLTLPLKQAHFSYLSGQSWSRAAHIRSLSLAAPFCPVPAQTPHSVFQDWTTNNFWSRTLPRLKDFSSSSPPPAISHVSLG